MFAPKVILITGASSGIGRAAVLAFTRQGHHVVGVARRINRLHDLALEVAKLPQPHGEFMPAEADVTNEETVISVVRQTIARFGRVDVLVANAGIGQRGAMVDASWQDLETVMRTNIDGVLYSIRAVVPEMAKTGGHILIISSVAASLVSPYAATYAASKAFVSSMANSLRIELASKNIQVTDFLIGRTETEFDENRLGAGKRSASRLPVMTADQVADALVKSISKRQKTVILRFFDRLIVWGNRLIPGIMGELAKRQYQ